MVNEEVKITDLRPKVKNKSRRPKTEVIKEQVARDKNLKFLDVLKQIFIQSIVELIYEIIQLLKVKTVITFAIVFTVCYLTIVGEIDTDAFMGLAGSVLTYYFARPARSTNDE